MVLAPTCDPKCYRLLFSKRGERAGAIDANGMENVDTIFLRQGEKNEGLSWTLCEAPAEDLTTLSKAQRAILDEFSTFPFPMSWQAMIDHLIKTKGMNYKTAKESLGKAASAGIIACPKSNGLWERGDRTLKEQPDF